MKQSKFRLDSLIGLAAISTISLMSIMPSTKAIAADVAVPDAAEAQASDWSFAIAPYFWMAGLNGSIGVAGRTPANVDFKFSQVFDHIDWWPPPIMFAGEARNDRFAIFTDFLYLGLQADGSIPGPRQLSATVNTNVLIWNIGGSYRIIDQGGVTLDGMAGGRLWHLKADQTFSGPDLNAEASGRKTWFDPLIGLAGNVDLGKGLRLHAEGDVGGFGVGADLDWQLQATLQYQYSRSVVLEAGYRYLSVDYDKNGFVFDTNLSGPIVAADFKF